jgi:photosystem II stability/assembly factor-like uncharacterized protein
VLQTTDGGQTWRQIPDQFKNKIRSVWFADPQHGWALAIDRNILATTDGGATWAIQRRLKIKLKLVGNRREPGWKARTDRPATFIDRLHGWAWGGGRKDEFAEQPGILLTTVDGGQNWNQIPYPFDQNTSTVFFLDADKPGPPGRQLLPDDRRGLNWERLNEAARRCVRAIFLLP